MNLFFSYSYFCQVLAASKNKISTLKGFPHLPSLEVLLILLLTRNTLSIIVAAFIVTKDYWYLVTTRLDPSGMSLSNKYFVSNNIWEFFPDEIIYSFIKRVEQA